MYYFLPVVMVVAFNTFYQVAAKGMPSANSTFANIVCVYLTATTASVVMFFATEHTGSLLSEIRQTNWAPFVLGVSVVGLEYGFILLYRVGWKMSLGSTVCSILLALVMIAVGALFYRERLSLSQICGIVFCAVGLFFLNR